MEDLNIRYLDQLLGEKRKIVERKIKCLTAPGDNYGSLMLSVDVVVQDSDGKNEEIKVVAKMLPPNEEMRQMFNCQITFKNETEFYRTIVPTLRDFQKENGVKELIDCFPEYYGGRFNLDGSNEIDGDAVLLLENLKVKNYLTLERTEGFDLEVSRLVVVDLAHLHAVPLALKLRKPEVFASCIKPHLASLAFDEGMLEDSKKKFFGLVRSIDELHPFVERIEKINFNVYPPPPPRELFATISHNDVWVNNTMVQMVDGKAVKNKLVDFQLCDYGSAAKDLLFFLFSSVKDHVLVKHYEELIQIYYNTFIEILQELHCETEPFSFDAFKLELDHEARVTQFVHTVLMLNPIFAPRGSVTDIKELKPSDISTFKVTDLQKKKLAFIVKEYAKRNWI